MIQNELDIRLKPAIENTSSNKVPLDGEIVFVKDTSNSANNNIRIGNGRNDISSLSNFLTMGGQGGGGTVTSVRVQATSPVQSSEGSAQSTTLNTTISLVDAYGDTKNPYGSKTANYVLAAPNGSAGAPSFRALVAADIPDLSSTYLTSVSLSDVGLYNVNLKYKLNSDTATTLGSISRNTNSDLIFPKFYAPTDAGTAGAFLVSGGSGQSPVWNTYTALASGDGLVEIAAKGFKSSSMVKMANLVDGGRIKIIGDENSTNPSLTLRGSTTIPIQLYDGNSSSIQNKIIHSSGLIDAPNGNTDANKYLKWTGSTFTWDTAGSSSFPNIGQGLYLNTSTNTLQLNLPVYPTGATTSNLGGIKTVGGIVNSGSYDVASSGTYYPVQTDNSGIAMVKVPSGGGTATTVNVVSGSGLTKSTSGNTVTLGLNVSSENGQGALLTTADVIPENVYINKDDVVAIPIFYSDGSDTSNIYEADEGTYPSEPKKEEFTGHYVNLHDIINGLIREPVLLRILSIALGIEQKQ